MTRSCYLVTTLDRVLELPGKNLIFDYTPFARKEYAIEGVAKMGEVEVPLVGRLELPDEFESTPDRCDPQYLVQLGYDPRIDKDADILIRLPIRRRHLMRLSVVSWDNVCDDDGGKEEVISGLRRYKEETEIYLKDISFEDMFNNPAELKEADALGKKFGDMMNRYDLLRKSHGLTMQDEDFLHEMKKTYYVLSIDVLGAKIARSVTDAEHCILPEMREVHLEQAAEFMVKYKLIEAQIHAETMRDMHKAGLDLGGFIPLDLGEDEMRLINSGRITMEQLIQQQMAIDAPESRNA